MVSKINTGFADGSSKVFFLRVLIPANRPDIFSVQVAAVHRTAIYARTPSVAALVSRSKAVSNCLNLVSGTPYRTVLKHEPLDRDRTGVTFQRLEDSATLRVGQTTYVCVYAHKRWNDSGVDVVSGQVFNFVVPAGEEWTDWQKRCGADGYFSTEFSRHWEVFRRVPKAKWLQLVGSIGKSSRTPLIIGSKLMDFLPPSPGRLYLFANDVPWMHWNNRGMIAVRITRTK